MEDIEFRCPQQKQGRDPGFEATAALWCPRGLGVGDSGTVRELRYNQFLPVHIAVRYTALQQKSAN
jgi:hypothetical protein